MRERGTDSQTLLAPTRAMMIEGVDIGVEDLLAEDCSAVVRGRMLSQQ